MGWIPTGTGSGVTDHGVLTGLADDDHPQYLLGTDGGKGTVNVVAAAGATETLDLADGNDHDVTLDTASCTLTLTGATNGVACFITILLRQDATGNRLVTWPASVEWVGGAAPTLQTAANAWDLVSMVTYDGGTTWFAAHAGTGSGGGGDGATILHGAEPQSDGSLRFRYGVDASGRPTYTAAGTTDTPAILILDDYGRVVAREVTL